MNKSYPAPPEPTRINKYLVELGLCSRREADHYISTGLVLVNGIPAGLGQKIGPGDSLTVTPELERRRRRKVTILLNKPVGFVSSQPEQDYKSAAELITAANFWRDGGRRPPEIPAYFSKLAPAGRLDIDSTGLLVLTQDGLLAKKIIGEKSNIAKEYWVRVTGNITAESLALLRHGLSLDGTALAPAKVSVLAPGRLKFILTQGKKRQIRRMGTLVGLTVTELIRVRIGKVSLGGLPRGKWRFLTSDEEF